MLRGFLRFLAYSLAFWFIYRVVVGAFRNLTQERKEHERPEPPPRQDPRGDASRSYSDVKDAQFKDIPKNPS